MPHSSLSKISYSWKARLLRQIGWIAPSSLSFLLRVMALSPAVMLTQPRCQENTDQGPRVPLRILANGRRQPAGPGSTSRLTPAVRLELPKSRGALRARVRHTKYRVRSTTGDDLARRPWYCVLCTRYAV